MDLTLSDDFQNYQAYGLTFSSNLPLTPWLVTSNQPASLMVEGCFVTEDLYNPEIAPLFTSPQMDRFGYPILHLYRLGEILYLRLPSAGGFFIGPDKIHVQIQPGIDLVVVCVTVLSYAFALWLEQHKRRCIHAAALSLHGQAAVFMADSMAGKSTMAAALLQAGAELLSDDIAPLMETMDGFMVSPACPAIRLSKPQAERFLGARVGLARWFPVLGKTLIPIGSDGWGAFCNTSRKLQRLYILNRNPRGWLGKTVFEPLSKTEAVLALVRFSFGRRSPLALNIAAERMAFFARLVEQADVVRLTYPSGYKCLTEVAWQIFQDMDKSERI